MKFLYTYSVYHTNGDGEDDYYKLYSIDAFYSLCAELDHLILTVIYNLHDNTDKSINFMVPDHKEKLKELETCDEIKYYEHKGIIFKIKKMQVVA